MTMIERPAQETPLVTTAQPEDFFQLLKPRVMSLVVFTAVTGLVVAPGQLSWVNIVIGGAAGALPPVIGWAAVTGDAPWQAWLLFLIIFMWTPPHTWALTLYSAGDYAKAGIPMMPVARGAKSTRLQIMLYSLAFVPVAIAPAFTGLGGPIYLVVSVAGGLGFLALAFRLWRSRAGDQPDKAEAVGREAALYDVRAEAKPARNLFAFSILYLMALFSALLVEHLSGVGV